MDIQKLKNTYKQLIAFMKQKNMINNEVCKTEAMCLHMIEHEGEYSSYPDYYIKYIDADGFQKGNKSSNHQRTVWRRIWAFEEFGHLPDGKVFAYKEMSGRSYYMLNSTFRKFVDKEVIPVLSNGQVHKKTIDSLTSLMSRFLHEMQINGASTLKKITEDRILLFFYKDGKQIRGTNTSGKLSMMFGRIDNPDSKRINALMPALRKKLLEFQPMTEDVVKRIKEELGKDNNFSLRDRAIITIALYTALRGEDIASLTIDSIDWNRDIISIIQKKTQQRLTLPMRAIVGNALFDYVKKEYVPGSNNRLLFHDEKLLSSPINGQKIRKIIKNFFKKTGILENGNQRRIRLLRHHLASTLLKKGEDINIIRSILGHTTKSAILSYLDIDIEDTRRCGLDISDYPVNDDIFDI